VLLRNGAVGAGAFVNPPGDPEQDRGDVKRSVVAITAGPDPDEWGNPPACTSARC